MVPVHSDEEDREERDDDGNRQVLRSHGEVEEENVKYDRAKDDQSEYRQNVEQEKKPSDDLAQKDHLHVTGGRNRRKKHSGGAVGSGRRAHWNKMEKTIEPEDDKNQSEQGTRNDSSDFHARKLKALARKDKMKKHHDSVEIRSSNSPLRELML